MTARYEMVVGLEVHVQLKTRTKAFCSCSADFGAAPNANTCPVCLALPGALPVLNRRAVELAMRISLGATPFSTQAAVKPSVQSAGTGTGSIVTRPTTSNSTSWG